jgi:D-sedoheptulose 7-phosphate isomerase
MSYARTFLTEVRRIAEALDEEVVEAMAERLAALRARGGRLFLAGVGGGAAHASHAAADFRKLAGIEAYAVTDNVAELTARTNDEGWATSFVEYLRGSRLRSGDAIMVFSVGGGDAERGISANIVEAVRYAHAVGAEVFGVVGRDGGFTARMSDTCVVVPIVNVDTVTPQTESFQAIVWHLLVSHPRLQLRAAKWESVAGAEPLTVVVP